MRKGEILRPCLNCGVIIRFEVWEDETIRRGKKTWHWAEERGEHHYCRTDELRPEQREHLKDILTGDLWEK